MMSNFDRAFRTIVNNDWGVKSAGNVEAPTGYFALVEIPEHDGEFTELINALFDGTLDLDEDEAREALNDARGWYVVVIDNNGLVFPNRLSVSEAEAEYERRCAEWLAWDEQDED